jgi:hypothetical protein
VVCVFARKPTEPLASLVKQIDKKIGETPKLKSFVVILTPDGATTAPALKKLAADAGVKNVPLTIHGDPAEVPDYEVSKAADVTVIMWSKHKVKVSRGFKGELTDADVQSIMADVPKVLAD